MKLLDYLARLMGTALGFSLFGLGGLILGILVLPLVHLFTPDRPLAYRRAQYLVHTGFRAFVWLMEMCGVVRVQVHGREKFSGRQNLFILANHPSLIDVVVIGSLVPHLVCVTKTALWRNPFTLGIMWGAGYIRNDDPNGLIDRCVEALDDGQTLLLFPEGTRTTPGQPLQFKRGAAKVALLAKTDITPIYIELHPTTLTRGEKWYDIPNKQAEFNLSIGDDMSIDQNSGNLEPTPIAVRQANAQLEAHFRELSGHYG